jgi:GTP cyclohydrolase I
MNRELGDELMKLQEAGLEDDTETMPLELTSNMMVPAYQGANYLVRQPEIDYEALQDHMAEILAGLGMNLDDPSVSETPKRVIKMLASFNQPFDAKTLLTRSFQSRDSGSIVAQSNIPFVMLCEHHLMPAIGQAYLAYLPHRGKVVGLSKLARLVDAVGRERPSLQETINDRIAYLLKEHLEATGVLVVIKAEHTCMTCRGAKTPGVVTTTSTVKGIFKNVPQAREEAFTLLGLR